MNRPLNFSSFIVGCMIFFQIATVTVLTMAAINTSVLAENGSWWVKFAHYLLWSVAAASAVACLGWSEPRMT